MSQTSNKRGFFVFDAYGTLFDVHSAVERHAELVGPNAARVSEIWRNKQLEYSWVRAAMGRYRDFWALTGEALAFALEMVPDSNKDAYGTLMTAYEMLDCYSEVAEVLQALQSAGNKTAILSNGSPAMLQKAVQSAGIGEHLDAVLSVDAISTFKTMPQTYELVTERFNCKAEEVTFMSSNRWDIAGATAFGFQCQWINRSGQADEYRELAPKSVLPDLTGLLPLVGASVGALDGIE